MSAEEHQTGDLVWAKMRGYPQWPARIVSCPPKQQSPSANHFYVFFYGSHDVAWMSNKDLLPFKKYQEKFRRHSQRQRPGLNEAIWEIEEDPDLLLSEHHAILKQLLRVGKKKNQKGKGSCGNKTQKIEAKLETAESKEVTPVTDSQTDSKPRRRSARLQQTTPNTSPTVAIPTDQATVTIDQTSDQATVTSDQANVTSDQATVTSDQANVTSDQATVTSDQVNVTSDQARDQVTVDCKVEPSPKSPQKQVKSLKSPGSARTHSYGTRRKRLTEASQENEVLLPHAETHIAESGEAKDMAETGTCVMDTEDVIQAGDVPKSAVTENLVKPVVKKAECSGNVAESEYVMETENATNVTRGVVEMGDVMSTAETMEETRTTVEAENVVEFGDVTETGEVVETGNVAETDCAVETAETGDVEGTGSIMETGSVVVTDAVKTGSEVVTGDAAKTESVVETDTCMMDTTDVGETGSGIVAETGDAVKMAETDTCTAEIGDVGKTGHMVETYFIAYGRGSQAETQDAAETGNVVEADVIDKAVNVAEIKNVDIGIFMEAGDVVEMDVVEMEDSENAVEAVRTNDNGETPTETRDVTVQSLSAFHVGESITEGGNIAEKDTDSVTETDIFKAVSLEEAAVKGAEETVNTDNICDTAAAPISSNLEDTVHSQTLQVPNVTHNLCITSEGDNIEQTNEAVEVPVMQENTSVTTEYDASQTSDKSFTVPLDTDKQKKFSESRKSNVLMEKPAQDLSKQEAPPQMFVSHSMSATDALRIYNYNLKASLVIGLAEPQKALKNLRELMDLKFTASDVGEVKDLVYTLRKVRRFKGNSCVRSKATKVYNKIKGLYCRPRNVKKVDDRTICDKNQMDINARKRKAIEDVDVELNSKCSKTKSVDTDTEEKQDEAICRRSQRSAQRGRVNYTELCRQGYSSEDEQTVPEL